MLGGMSWESTAEYYRLTNTMVRERLGGLHSARIVLHSVDFAEIEKLQVAGRWDDAGQVLADAAMSLEAAGADLVVLCTNTMHKVADQIEAAIAVPLVHLVDATAEAAKRAGLTRVGLLGTVFTMEQGLFYRDRMAHHGVELVIPSVGDRGIVHDVIYEELCLGVVRDSSRQRFLEVIDDWVSRGAEGVILGCTEIELLISQADVRVPVFATTQIHVAAAVALALG
ncbi:aspartate/glutamate racemase family protein [soil metagenome]